MLRSALWLSMIGLLSLAGCSSSSSGGTPGAGGSGGSTAGAGGSLGAGGSAGGTTGAGGTGTGGSAGTGGTTGACGIGSGTSTGDTCNSVALNGPCVTPQLSTGTVPTGMGGPISNGTFLLTSETLYADPDAGITSVDGGLPQGARRQTFVLSNATSTSFTLDQVTISGTRTGRSHGTAAIAGTMVTFTPTCPPPTDGGDDGNTGTFTATSATITLIQSAAAGTVVSVYTKS